MLQKDVLCLYILPPYGDYLDRAEIFVNSYNKHTAGVSHELAIILKDVNYVPDRVKKIFENVNCDYVLDSNEGYDIGSYIRMSKLYAGCKYLMCFGNSSVILVDNWLNMFYNIAERISRLGILGAFGSYERGAAGVKEHNPHIRTTGFMFRPEVLNSFDYQIPKNKEEMYQFEHGENSFTNKCLNNNYSCYVVGRDSKIYDIHEWQNCNGFRHGDQSNLIFHDKHCESFIK